MLYNVSVIFGKKQLYVVTKETTTSSKGVYSMSHAKQVEENRSAAFSGWRFNETVEIEREKQTLENERREIENLRSQLEKEKEEFQRKIEWEEQRMKRENELFEMKLRILESELQKLATDKERFEQQKAFYARVNEFENCHGKQEQTVRGDMFFVGVEDRTSLKKRYKDLIKIYHPDNVDGDTMTIQEINNEYQKLAVALEA